MVSPVSGSVPNPSCVKKMTAEEIKKVPEKIEETGKAINDSLDKINDTMKRTTESVGGIAITGAGLFTTLKKPFVAMFDWLKEAKINPETGEELLDKAGNVVKQYNKNKLIGVGVVLGLLTTAILIAKYKNKKPENIEKAQEIQIAKENTHPEPPKEEKLDIAA